MDTMDTVFEKKLDDKENFNYLRSSKC